MGLLLESGVNGYATDKRINGFAACYLFIRFAKRLLTPSPNHARIPIKPVPLAVVGAVEEARPTGTAMEDHV